MADLSAAQAAHAVVAGRTRPWDFMAALLARFDKDVKFHNALLKGKDAFGKDEALEALRAAVAQEAAEATRTGTRFATSGPLAAVAFAVSPQVDVRGYSTHANNAALVVGRALVDAPAVAALRGAGAELLGRATMSELNARGLLPHPVTGLVKNVRRPPAAARPGLDWRRAWLAAGWAGSGRPDMLLCARRAPSAAAGALARASCSPART